MNCLPVVHGPRNHLFSAGQGSFRAAMIDRRRNPDAPIRLLFTDTLYEDADAYRFLIEGAARVLDRNLNWTVDIIDAPDYRVDPETPIEEYRGNPQWRAWIADLRARATDAMPELVWITEGRDPWEVYRDGRFLGNSGVDPCSRVLKREALAAWRSANCHRIGELFGPPDVFTVGIGDHEAHRFNGDRKSAGIRRIAAADGWLYEAPLLTEPLPGEYDLFFAPLEVLGLAEPRLYTMGYAHNNCGGNCCKAGQAHWANRFRVQPDRYAYDALMEEKVRVFLGADVAMMTDRRGGEKKPLTLVTFAERLAADPTLRPEYEGGDSGCGCMFEPEPGNG